MNEPVDLVGLVNTDTGSLQRATSAHTHTLYCIYICPLDWFNCKGNRCKSTGHFTSHGGGDLDHCPKSSQSTLSMINICMYKKWVNSKKNGNKGPTCIFKANIKRVRNAPWLPMFPTCYLSRLWKRLFNLIGTFITCKCFCLQCFMSQELS